MRIDRLHVQNFRLFKDAEFSFAPGLNLVVGDNGGGKTAVIEALSVAAGSWFLGIRGQDVRSFRSEDIHVEAKQLPRDRFSFTETLPVVVEANGQVLDRSISWRRSKDSLSGKTKYAQAGEMKALSEAAFQRASEDDNLTLPVISNYGSGRLHQGVRTRERVRVPRVRHGGPNGRFSAYKLSVDSRIDIIGFLRFFANEAWSAFQSGEPTPEFEAVRAALLKCTDGAHRVDFNPGTGELVADIKDSGLVPFSFLSDGQRTVIAMVGDLCRKVLTLNPHLGASAMDKTPGVVLIDEIDLHLHPNWQRRICSDLERTFPSVQFISTTHSPQVIGSVSKDRVIRLEAINGWRHPITGTLGAESNEILRHVMGSNEQAPEVKKLAREIEAALDSDDLQSAQELLLRYLDKTEGPTHQRTYLETLVGNARLLDEAEEPR
jgi:predicted ATP-binding protein involved in virulence